MRSDTQLWTRHEMDMGEGMPEEVFHMPATPEEIKEAMPDAMHWLPMTEGAVFDDEALYLLRDREDGSIWLALWMQSAYGFAMSIDYLENKERFSHYARIINSQPKPTNLDTTNNTETTMDTTLKGFDDLEFNNATTQNPFVAEQAIMFFPNGFGVSVISGLMTRGGKDGKYEMAILTGSPEDYELCYDTPITSDVLGHLTPDDVTNYMKKVQSLPTLPTITDDGITVVELYDGRKEEYYGEWSTVKANGYEFDVPTGYVPNVLNAFGGLVDGKTIYLLNIEDENNESNREYGYFGYTPIEAYTTPEARAARMDAIREQAKGSDILLAFEERDVVIGVPDITDIF